MELDSMVEDLPEEQKRRAEILLGMDTSGIRCAQAALYISGHLENPDEQGPGFERIRNLPYEALSDYAAPDGIPGDVAVFFRDGYPEHFAVSLGNGHYFSKFGRREFRVDSQESISKFYNSDYILFFRRAGSRPLP